MGKTPQAIPNRLDHGQRIADQMKGKATMVPRVPVASVVAEGEYQIGFQQVAELLPIRCHVCRQDSPIGAVGHAFRSGNTGQRAAPGQSQEASRLSVIGRRAGRRQGDRARPDSKPLDVCGASCSRVDDHQQRAHGTSGGVPGSPDADKFHCALTWFGSCRWAVATRGPRRFPLD